MRAFSLIQWPMGIDSAAIEAWSGTIEVVVADAVGMVALSIKWSP